MDVKRVFACAALLAGLLFFNGRLSAAVESDIVGYTTMTMEAGKWYMVGTPFEDLTTEEIRINKHFIIGFSEGDILQLYKSGKGYTVYRFKENLSGDQTAGWCTAFGKVPVDVVLAPGEAVFLQKNTTAVVSVAGKVDTVQTFEFGTDEGNSWQQLVSPSAETTKLNDLQWVGLKQGDILQIYESGTGYKVYRFKENLKGEKTSGWCTAFGTTPVDVDVSAGTAFFLNKVSPGKGTVSVK